MKGVTDWPHAAAAAAARRTNTSSASASAPLQRSNQQRCAHRDSTRRLQNDASGHCAKVEPMTHRDAADPPSACAERKQSQTPALPIILRLLSFFPSPRPQPTNPPRPSTSSSHGEFAHASGTLFARAAGEITSRSADPLLVPALSRCLAFLVQSYDEYPADHSYGSYTNAK